MTERESVPGGEFVTWYVDGQPVTKFIPNVTRAQEIEMANRLADKGYIEKNVRDEIVKKGLRNIGG